MKNLFDLQSFWWGASGFRIGRWFAMFFGQPSITSASVSIVLDELTCDWKTKRLFEEFTCAVTSGDRPEVQIYRYKYSRNRNECIVRSVQPWCVQTHWCWSVIIRWSVSNFRLVAFSRRSMFSAIHKDVHEFCNRAMMMEKYMNELLTSPIHRSRD